MRTMKYVALACGSTSVFTDLVTAAFLGEKLFRGMELLSFSHIRIYTVKPCRVSRPAQSVTLFRFLAYAYELSSRFGRIGATGWSRL